jgi:signal transduction histidine kinase/CheY-like chemotaxis protein
VIGWSPRGSPTRTWLDEDFLHDPQTLAKAYVFLGGAYPFWALLAPSTSQDPPVLWLSVGVAYVLIGGWAWASRSPVPSAWLHLPTFAVTAHLNMLFALNPREPFYAVAGVLAVFAAVLVLPNAPVQVAYAALVLGLAAIQIVYGVTNSPFFALGVVWMLALGIRHFRQEERARARVASDLHVAQTELAHERSERERLQEELLIAQRMDALGRLAGAFSHEFNNQLMAIRIHAELLENSLPGGAPQRRDIDQIHATTSAAADLTARLLAFSRPSRTNDEPADLSAVVRQNVVTLRHLMSEKIPVAWAVPEVSGRGSIGAKQLNQIMLNLALNARDAMPLGGALRIEVTRRPRAAVELPIDIPCETLVVLTVSDTGSGIAHELRDRIFEPFFTTKGDRGNTGLGLSIVYGIVKETGGHIRVTSEAGKGTRFDLYWPELVANAAGAIVAAPVIAKTEPHRARVLLVEDQAVLRDGLTRWLGARGFAVVSCESAEEALARANGIDVIASDVVLRGMDGIELLGRLRRRTPLLPAVLFSGHLDHLATQRRKIPEGVMFLEKPFAPEALVTTIDSLVEAARAGSLRTAH